MSLFNSCIATAWLLGTGVQVWFTAAQVSESLPALSLSLTHSQPRSKSTRHVPWSILAETIDGYHLAKLTFHSLPSSRQVPPSSMIKQLLVRSSDSSHRMPLFERDNPRLLREGTSHGCTFHSPPPGN
ncbi:hypothetical protein J3F84DRAFT_135732 [Trichoderma pleuroticola]